MKYEFQLDMNNSNSAYTQCLNLIKPNSKVLDVGCAMGIIGEYLVKEKLCEAIGVDIVDEFLNEARKKNIYKKLYKLNLDLLTNELDLYQGYFDYILMADVIEHTYNPKDILEKLKQLLNPNGKFIMSIPNISHGSIKLSLLANVFRYSEMGLLDKTHIRFFTRENIINLLTESNLQIEEENFVIHAPENIYFEPKNLMNYPPSIIKFVESDPYSYVYQFILSVKPSLNVDNKKKLNLRDIPVENAKGIKWKDIIKFMIRKPLFLFRKDFWELVKRK